MKNTIYLLAISLIVVFIGGCSKSSQISSMQSNSFQAGALQECVIDKAKAPSWICNGGIVEGVYTEIGEAQKTHLGIGFQRNEAMSKARASLSQQLSAEVKSKVENFERSTGVSDDEGVERVGAQVSKSVAKNTLEGSKQMAFWQHPETKSVWVLVGLSKENFKNGIKSSFGDREKQWQQFEASKALDALDKEFEDKQKQDAKEFMKENSSAQ